VNLPAGRPTDKEENMIRRLSWLLLLTPLTVAAADDTLWKATPLTPPEAFTKGIEGPATDAQGNIFAVN
jgi:hypothetical protein